jgi:glycosyltransferase involved in cell wall biosynthesis
MRVTFLLPGWPWRPVGGYKVVYQYANYLVARGHSVSVVHPRRMPNYRPPDPPGLGTRLRLRAGQIRNLLVRPRVRWNPIDRRVAMLYVADLAQSRVPDADAVVATAWQTAEHVSDYPRSKGTGFYLVQGYETWSGPQARVDATWRSGLKKIVVARWLFAKGLELGVPSGEMIRISNGIDHSRYRVSRPIEGRGDVAAMMASPLALKATAAGLGALEAARRQCPDLTALLFGAGRKPTALPAWASYYRDPPQDFLVESIYNRSAVYLCPSTTEGCALPPAEAMACGCALVSTDIGGVRDYAEHDVTALLSPVGDVPAMAGNIQQLLADPQRRRALALAGGGRIREFTWERSAGLMEQFLRDNL